MGRVRQLLAAMLLCGALAHPGLPPASASPIPELAGTTVISGSTSGMIEVHLSRDTEVSTFPFRNKLGKISSTGRIAGFVLKEDVPKGGIEIVGLSVALCEKAPCKEKRIGFTQVWDPARRGFPERIVLPAGNYLLSLIADNSDTEVVLSLPGVAGTSSLDVGSPGDIDIVTPKTTFGPVSSKNLYAAEAKQTLEGIGYAVLAYEVETESSIFSDIDTCLQRKSRDGATSLASAPLLFSTCEGSGTGSFFVDPGASGGRQLVVSMSTVAKGGYFHSIAAKIAGEVESFESLALDFSFPRGKRSGGFSSGVFYSDNF